MPAQELDRRRQQLDDYSESAIPRQHSADCGGDRGTSHLTIEEIEEDPGRLGVMERFPHYVRAL